MLGTVAEEESLIGTVPTDSPMADSATAANSSAGLAAPLCVPDCQQGAAAPQGGGAGPSPLMPLNVRDLHISLQPHSSMQTPSPLASPRHSGCGTSGCSTTGLRPPTAQTVAGFAAGFSALRHRSPFDKPISPTSHSQHGQREQELVGKQNKQVLRRRSSGSSSQEELSVADGRRSTGSIDSTGDSSTSLIREGACRSDMG